MDREYLLSLTDEELLAEHKRVSSSVEVIQAMLNHHKNVEEPPPAKLVQVCHHCGGSGEEPYSQPNQSKIKLIQAAKTLSEYINQLDKDTFTCGDLFKIKLAQHVVESYKL